jgi:poly-beta-1,6-N-acetyl-D-glucosamine N-deacetylase
MMVSESEFGKHIKKKVLCFHKVEHPDIFEQNLQLISKSSDVLLTFDDGHWSFYEYGFPLLKKYQIPAVLFIVSSLINTNQPFWWDEVRYYLGRKEGNKVLRELKKMPNAHRVEYFQKLRQTSDKPPLTTRQLTITELQEMQANGIIIANHSHTHPMFDQCTEQELVRELQSTREFFQVHQLKGYHIFAYPNGNHSDMAEKILRQQGIEFAFLFDHKISGRPINRFRISRLSVNDYTPVAKMRFILSGWHSRLLPIRKMIAGLFK